MIIIIVNLVYGYVYTYIIGTFPPCYKPWSVERFLHIIKYVNVSNVFCLRMYVRIYKNCFYSFIFFKTPLNLL